MPKSAKKRELGFILPTEIGSNPMQKFVELLHWEYHTGVLTTKRYPRKNKSATLKRYRSKPGVEEYVDAQIALLPYHMQKIAIAVGKPKSIDLMFTTFTNATEYILQHERARKLIEIMSLVKFGSEDIESALSLGSFAEEVFVRDIERYKYFYWQVDPPHMKLEDNHRLMRQFDRSAKDEPAMTAGFTMHVAAFYGRSTIELMLMTLGVNYDDLMKAPSRGVETNLKIINEKLFLELGEPGFSGEAMDMARSSAAMLRALNNTPDDSTAGKLRGKLQTETEHEGDIENLKKRNDSYLKAMETQGNK